MAGNVLSSLMTISNLVGWAFASDSAPVLRVTSSWGWCLKWLWRCWCKGCNLSCHFYHCTLCTLPKILNLAGLLFQPLLGWLGGGKVLMCKTEYFPKNPKYFLGRKIAPYSFEGQQESLVCFQAVVTKRAPSQRDESFVIITKPN